MGVLHWQRWRFVLTSPNYGREMAMEGYPRWLGTDGFDLLKLL